MDAVGLRAWVGSLGDTTSGGLQKIVPQVAFVEPVILSEAKDPVLKEMLRGVYREPLRYAQRDSKRSESAPRDTGSPARLQ